MLYAIRNGGFSSGPMPQNIVVGEEAEEVAAFVAKYSGSDVARAPGPAELPAGAPATPPSSADARAPMLDLKAIRRDPEPVRAALARRGDGSDERLDEVLELDARRRELLPRGRGAARRAEGGLARASRAPRRPARTPSAAIAAMQEVSRRVKALGEELEERRGRARRRLLASLPNPPDPSAADEDTTLREVGEATARAAPTTSSSPGALIDMEAGARVAGSRFAYLQGRPRAARARARALGARGAAAATASSPVIPPVLVREEALYGTGFLPDTEQQIYRLADDPLYLAGHERGARWPRCTPARSSTSEALPLRYAGFSPCFRREAGAAGRDTRGIFRVHQFDKVEMFCVRRARRTPRPSTSGCSRSRRRSSRRSRSPTAWSTSRSTTSASSAAKKYDCEAWLPGQERYRELTSTSNTTDFQARRLDIRYRGPDGAPRHVHTLNGTAVAVGAHADRGPRERPAGGRHGRDPRGAVAMGRPAGTGSDEMSKTTTRPHHPSIPPTTTRRCVAAPPRSTTNRWACPPTGTPSRSATSPASPARASRRPPNRRVLQRICQSVRPGRDSAGMFVARLICSDSFCPDGIVAEAETLKELETARLRVRLRVRDPRVPDHVQETAVVVSLGRYRRRHARPRPPVGEAA